MSERDHHGDKSAPRAVVGRVGLYLRQLESFRSTGQETISSRQLGESLNLSDAQVRKDLAFFGQFGSPGIGYRIDELIGLLKRILGVDRVWPLALVGVGNLGRALLKYRGFRKNGFLIAALFDKSSAMLGQRIDSMVVQPMDRFAETVQAQRISLAVLCVPGEEAQAVADLAVASGVMGILNFAPVALSVPASVEVVDVDLSIHLERLAYHVQNAAGRISEAG